MTQTNPPLISLRRRDLVFGGISFFLGLICIVLLSHSCNQTRKLDQVEELNAYNEQEIVKSIDKQGRQEAKIQAYQTTVTELKQKHSINIEALKKEVKRLKNLHSITSFSTNTSDTIYIPLTDTVLISNESSADQPPVRGRKFDYKDQYLVLAGLLEEDTVKVSYAYKDKYLLKQEWERSGPFKPPLLTTTIRPENPKADITEIHSISIEPPKPKWYETRLFSFLAGLVSGTVLKSL